MAKQQDLFDSQFVISRLGGDGILRTEDIPRFSEAQKVLAELMRDGEWHTRHEIVAALPNHVDPMRRMYQLKDHGATFDRRRTDRGFEFKMTAPPTFIVGGGRDDSQQ